MQRPSCQHDHLARLSCSQAGPRCRGGPSENNRAFGVALRGRSTTQESSPQRRDGEALRRELPSRSFFWGSDWRLIPRRQNRSGALNIVSSCCVSSTEVPPSRAHIPASSIATTAHGRLIGGWATTPRCPRSGPGAASSLVTPDGAALPARPDPLLTTKTSQQKRRCYQRRSGCIT